MKWLGRSTLMVAVLCMALGAPLAAHAKKGKKDKKGKQASVELVGLKSLDETFKQLRKLDNKVSSAEKETGKSQRNLNKALGIKNDAPVKKALEDLENKAKGKIGLTMDGKKPKLQATDAVPQNVSDAIDAVNKMTSSFTKSLDDLAGAKKEAEKLAKKAQKMPASVKDEFKKDSGSFIALIFKLPKTMGAVKGNVQVALSLPGRTTKVVGQMTGILGTVTSTFSPL